MSWRDAGRVVMEVRFALNQVLTGSKGGGKVDAGLYPSARDEEYFSRDLVGIDVSVYGLYCPEKRSRFLVLIVVEQ